MYKIAWQRFTTLLLMIVSIQTVFPYDAKIGEFYYSFHDDEATVVCYSSDRDVKPTYGACYQQTSYTIPSIVRHDGLDYTVRYIGTWAFGVIGNDTSPLRTINLPHTLRIIGDNAFYGCENLSKIIIPSEVIGFSYIPFVGCNNLRQIIYTSPEPPVNWVASGKTYVPCKEHYSNPVESRNNARIIELITWGNNEFIYSGQSPLDLKYSCNVPGYKVSLDISNLNNNVGHHECNITATFIGEDDSFTAIIPYEYDIRPKTLNIIVENTNRLYGEENPEFKVSFQGFVNGEDQSVIDVHPSVSSPADIKSNIGIYPIIITGGEAKNYTFNYINGELIVLPAPLMAKVNSVSREYGDSNPSFTLIYEGLKNEETEPSWSEKPVFSTTATMTSAVGDYPITAMASPQNYELSQISNGTLTILPAKLNLIAQNKSRLYYEENPEFTFYYSGFRNGETEAIVSSVPSLMTSATKDSNSGKYDILISDISVPNYEIQYQNGVLTINPRNLSVTTGIYERPYGEENPIFELIYDGFVGGQNESDLKTPPTAYTNATNTSSVGSYPIHIDGGVAQNYSFNYSHGKLNIVKAEQDLIWNQDLTNLTKGQQVELLAFSTSGLPITYAVDNATVCEVYSVGNKKYLDCLGDGEIQIRASQDGNVNYYPTPRTYKKVIVSNASMEKPTLTIKQLPIGSISTIVDWGETYSFTITPEPYWAVNAISINGSDYTSKMDSNGTFTSPPITQNTSITISYKDLNVEIDDISVSSIKVLGCVGGIKVLGAKNDSDIYVYSIDGLLLKIIKSNEGEIFIPLSPNCTYIVKVENLTTKIMI